MKKRSGQFCYLNATATAGTAPYSYLEGRRFVNWSVESCPYSFTLCRVYIGNDD